MIRRAQSLRALPPAVAFVLAAVPAHHLVKGSFTRVAIHSAVFALPEKNNCSITRLYVLDVWIRCKYHNRMCVYKCKR